MHLESSERANRAALLLAKERYDAQLAPFVAKKPERFAYIQSDLNRLIKECAEEVGADVEYLDSRFRDYLATKSEPKHVDLQYENADGWVKFKGGDDEIEGIFRDDVANDEPTVTEEEAAKADETYDLGQDTAPVSKVTSYKAAAAGDLTDVSTWNPCYRCGDKLNPVYAQTSPVCAECTNALLALGAGENLAQPITDVPQQCTICGQQGTMDEIRAHIQEQHQDVIQRQQQGQPGGPMPVSKVAAPPEPDPTAPPQDDPKMEDPVKVPPAGTEPADLFDSMVQELANRAAARQFSIPSDEEVTQVAEQYGLSEDEVRDNLVISATFGDYTSVNGEVGAEAPADMEEIDFGGAVDAHEALVPTDLVVQTVASETGTQPDLVYNMVRDRYGADLDDKYHASVTGDHKFYLPAGMAQTQDAIDPIEPVQPYDPSVGPTLQPAMQ